MCGRFSLYTPPARVARFFAADLADDIDPVGRPSWNIAPTTEVAAIAVDGRDERTRPDRVLDAFRWGLIPSWSEDASVGNRLFNARAETLTDRASFRSAFLSRRAIVPADGFFEWQKGTTRKPVPHYFHRRDGDPLAFAGLWEFWRDPSQAGDHRGWLRSCAIITTPANEDIEGIHDRMPVILEPDELDEWLDPHNDDRHQLQAVLEPPPPGTLTHHRVDARVGNVANDDPGLIAALSEDPTGLAEQLSFVDPPAR